MEIHDKFVIELREVIKAHGNDYRVKDPFNLPCDYKFYEISGVAICEESFKKMTPLETEINIVLDKIRAEIEENAYPVRYDHNSIEKGMTITGINQVLDKYRKEN